MSYEDDVRDAVVAGIAVNAALMDAQPDMVRLAARICAAASQMTLRALEGAPATQVADEVRLVYPDCPFEVARIVGVLAGDLATMLADLHGVETAVERVTGIRDGRLHTAGIPNE